MGWRISAAQSFSSSIAWSCAARVISPQQPQLHPHAPILKFLLRLGNALEHLVKKRIAQAAEHYADAGRQAANSERAPGNILGIARLLQRCAHGLLCFGLHAAAVVQHAVHRAGGIRRTWLRFP